MSSPLKQNTITIQNLIDTINNLPEAGGVELPELSNPAAASELFDGKQLIDGDGNVVTGTFTIDSELSAQDDLIAQIQTALIGKAGVVLPELSNPATAENLEEGYELIDGNGNVVVGTHVCSGGGDEETITFSVVNNLPDLIQIYGKLCMPNEITVITVPREAFDIYFMPVAIWCGFTDGELRDYYNDYYIITSLPMLDEDNEFYDETFGLLLASFEYGPSCYLGITEAVPCNGEQITIYCEEV